MSRLVSVFFALLLITGLSTPSFAAAPAMTGYWVTGKNEAVAQIYSCGDGLLCGELVGFPMDRADDPMPQTWEHHPQCHFVFIRYLRENGDSWSGTIINPRNGTAYGAKLRVMLPDRLRLRGFVLTPLLGSTRLWTRYTGPTPPADCRMVSGSLN